MPISLKLVALVLGLAALVGACNSGRRDPGPELLDAVDVVPEVVVEVDDTGFAPTSLAIEVGEAFEIANTGEEPHSFVIDEPYVDTGLLLPGERTVIVLTSPGNTTARDAENPDATLDIEVSPES